MLYSENYHQPRNTDSFENNEHLQNNSISSSVSSSSSATNSSIGNKDTLTNNTAFRVVKQRSSASPTIPNSKQNTLSYKKNPTQVGKLTRHSSMLNRTEDGSFGHQLKIKNISNSSSSALGNKGDSKLTASYTFKTYDPNRMSCYDNENELLNGYLSACNSGQIKSEYQNSQNIVIPENAKNAIDFTDETVIIPAYAKRASYQRGSFKKGAKEMSTSSNRLDKSENLNLHQISGSNMDLRNNNQRTHLSKAGSNNNLFARALNYAFKKSGKQQQQSPETNENGNLTATWKSKLGKYLSSTTGLNLKSAKSQNLEACNLDMGDDFSATYHLSRRNPVSDKKSNNPNQFNLNTTVNKYPSNNSNANNANNQNPTQLFLCLSSSSSSSGSNNSTSLSTPASFEAQNILTTLGTNKNQESNNLSYTIPISTEEHQLQPEEQLQPKQQQKKDEMRRSVSKSKSNSQKISDLASCVGAGHSKQQQHSDSNNTTNTANDKSNTINRKMINSGFNSLRKMLKMSTVASAEPAKTPSTPKKIRNKCLSASATPLPSCLAPQKQFSNGDSYTDSQNSAYSSNKSKPKETKKYKKSTMELSHNNITTSKLSLHRQSMTSLNSPPSTPKSSKHSSSLNPSHFTKSIINQTSSSFSSASLSSSVNFTPDLAASQKPRQNGQSSPQKHSYHSIEPIIQSASHTSLNAPSPDLLAITNKKSHYNTITSNHLPKKSPNYLGANSLKPRKEYKSEKSVLPKDFDEQSSASNQKKMINMLKVYKNVLNKMQKGSNNNLDTSLTNLDTNCKKVVTSKAFQPPASSKQVKSANIQKRFSEEFALKQPQQSKQQFSSFSANKVNKKSTPNTLSTSGIKAKTSPLKIVTYNENNASNDNENKQIVLANSQPANLNNSLKNVNKKARKLKEKISPEEEFMCDQEVASYFEPIRYNEHADVNVYECEDIYYFDEQVIEPTKFKTDSYILEDHSLEDDSKNLEVLVRQLAAEAALSTLSENKLTKDSEADYMKSFTDIFGKVNEKILPVNKIGHNGYLYKNKAFVNYESPKAIKPKNKVHQKYYSDEDKRLVYELIENEFGFSEEDYHLLKQIQNEQINDSESLSDEFLNRHSSESISPSNFKYIDEVNHASAHHHRYPYEDDVQSLLKNNDNAVYSSYEVDNIENWLDSISNLKIQPSKSGNNSDAFKNGFLSLKVKQQRNTQRVSRTMFQQPENMLQSKKRSSSSTSFQPACNYLQIVEKPQVPTRTNSITIDINDNASLSSSKADRSVNSFNNNEHRSSNPHIKIEKKIRLNYQRPHDPHSILNFGTLC